MVVVLKDIHVEAVLKNIDVVVLKDIDVEAVLKDIDVVVVLKDTDK
jgi:hypothetical protein